MKKCSICEEFKSLDNFYKYSDKESRRGVCKACLKVKRQSEKIYMEKRKKDYTPDEQRFNNLYLMRRLV